MNYRKCTSCGAREVIPLSYWSKFKLYRWWKGGRWAKLDGLWLQAGERGYLKYPGRGVHFTFLGVTAREDYRKNKNDDTD